MHRILSAAVETAAAAVFVIPVFLHLHKVKFQSSKTSLTALFFALYLCAVYSTVGLPDVRYIRFDPGMNLIPFRYMFQDASTYWNLLLFAPLGCFLPLLRSKFRSFPRTLLFGFGMSVFIEFFQLFTHRATDVNDLITNTLGTVLGYLLGMVWLKCFPKLSVSDDRNTLPAVFVTVLIVMFFLQPFSAPLFWSFLYR